MKWLNIRPKGTVCPACGGAGVITTCKQAPWSMFLAPFLGADGPRTVTCERCGGSGEVDVDA